jgi:hypothetical protein
MFKCLVDHAGDIEYDVEEDYHVPMQEDYLEGPSHAVDDVDYSSTYYKFFFFFFFFARRMTFRK